MSAVAGDPKSWNKCAYVERDPPNGVTEAFWPWGEERGTVTGNDRTKWGTYWRDSESSLDYGGNRYYDSVTGRFMTADPYGGSAVAGDPQSWNRYAYGLGDPVNGNDPTGLDSQICPASGETGQCYTVPDGSSYSGNTDVTVDENGVPIGITNITNTESVTVNGDSGVSDPNLYNASDPTGAQPGDPGQQGGRSGGGGTSVAPNNGGLLHKTVCSAFSWLTSAASSTNSTIGVGFGGSAGVGFILGVAASIGIQVVADSMRNLGVAFNAGGNPGYAVFGVGALGGAASFLFDNLQHLWIARLFGRGRVHRRSGRSRSGSEQWCNCDWNARCRRRNKRLRSGAELFMGPFGA